MSPEEIVQKVSVADGLPSLPKVAIDVLEMSKRDDVSVDELTAVIQNDPVLTAKMLKMVNSSLFGVAREVSSIKRAVGLLGMRSVKVMALSFSLVDTLNTDDQDGFDYAAYWRRALTTGVAARLIGRTIKPAVSEEAFVAGLLADIGMVAAWRCVPTVYREILDIWRATGQPLPQVERDKMGFTHAYLSGTLLETWGLPKVICEAIATHRGDGAEAIGEPGSLPTIIHAAAILADLFCQEVASAQLDCIKDLCIEKTGIAADKLEQILEAIDEHVNTTAAMLSVHVGETIHYTQLQAEATMQLAQLSMQAEAERKMSERREQAALHETELLNKEKKRILEAASTDGLTKIANRAAFDKRLAEDMERARTQAQSIGLIMLDVDHFKSFNDTHGHQAGDEVLRSVARALRETAVGRAFVARYGGEEFAAIFTNQSIAAVRELAEAIRHRIEQTTIDWEGTELRVTASLGAAVVMPSEVPISDVRLIEQADKLLYMAKHNGRNQVQAANLVPAKKLATH